MIMFMTFGLLAGCSKTANDTPPVNKPTAALTDIPTAAPDLTDYGTDVTATPAVKDDTADAADTASTPEATATPEPTDAPTEVPTATPELTLEPTPEPTKAPTAAPAPIEYKGSLEIPSDITDPMDRMEYIRSTIVANADYYNSLSDDNDQTWCFKRMKDHTVSGSYETFKISDFHSCYADLDVTDDDKVIYLTFDCGYPSDLTVQILDTLKAHNAKANFFVTKMYLEKCGDYAKRMKAEGHAVCNHTVHHEDLRGKSVEKIVAEIMDVAEYFYELTGYEFDPYFRTPTGAYTKRLLSIIRDCGYNTVFWSIAYGDYDKNNQPAPGYVIDHFTTYHHNGAIALMHNDSTSNANELDAVLTMLENEGYRFALLNELDD